MKWAATVVDEAWLMAQASERSEADRRKRYHRIDHPGAAKKHGGVEELKGAVLDHSSALSHDVTWMYPWVSARYRSLHFSSR